MPTRGPNSPRESDRASGAPPAIQTETPSQSKLRHTVGSFTTPFARPGDPRTRAARSLRSLAEHLREDARLRSDLRDELLLAACEGDDRQAAELGDLALGGPGDVSDRGRPRFSFLSP